MEFLEDVSLVCCASLCFLAVVGVMLSATLLRRIDNFVGDTTQRGRKMYKSTFDFGGLDDVVDRFLK